jgi:phage gp29-like protein
MSNNAPIITSLEALRTLKQQKYNPLRSLTPASLARVLEAFDIGYLRDGAILFETIAERDDTLKSVKPKREKDVSQLERQVLALPGTGGAGELHREVLEDFWNNVRAVNAYDRNERGGFRRLVKQMMSAVSYRYACHHIVWQPVRGQLRATFEFVPLWLFENRTGILRYLRSPFAMSGEMLDPSEWMITQGDGLMIACSIGYLAKRGAFNDWLIFSEKFSVPGILGRTVAKKGSAEGEAMRAAVESFGHDWTGVIYGDDGTHAKPLEIVQAAGNPTGMPMPAVVERVDRKFAAIYRGADLSTMSAGSGEGSGASLQGKETSILLADDAETINETLAEVSRMVIEWHFGRGTEPLAAVYLVPPSGRDDQAYLAGVQAMVSMGVRVSKDAVLERLGIQEAGEGEEFLTAARPPVIGQESLVTGKEMPVANSSSTPMTHDPSTHDAIRSALAEDLQPLGDALFGALQTGDQAAMNAALKKISARMPEFMDSPALTALLGEQFAAALAGESEEEINTGNANGARKGWETRRRNGWKPASRPPGTGRPAKPRQVESVELVLDAAFVDVDSRDFAVYEELASTSARSIREATLASAGQRPHSKPAPDLTGWKRIVEADKVNKVLSKHGGDRWPVEEEDFRNLPQMLAQPARQFWEEVPGKPPVLRSEVSEGRRTIIIEEAYTAQKQLTLLSIYRP